MIFGAQSNNIVTQQNIFKTAKVTWEFLKTRHVEATCIFKAWVEALLNVFETMIVGGEELVVEFFGSFLRLLLN